MSNKSKIAIIGGGLSGLVTAQNLNNDFDVTLFEKARGVGGRMSTRRADPYQFDHGAQYFTARSKRFKEFLRPHIETGLVQEWKAKILTLEKGAKAYKREWFEPHYVCAPRMNSLCKHLQKGIKFFFSAEISSLEKQDDQWRLVDKDGVDHGIFDFIIITAPAEQTANLVPDDFEHLEKIQNTQMTGCYSVMLGFETLPKLNWDIAMPKNSIIGWMAVNSLKPDRETAPSIIIQSTNEWADENMEEDMQAMGGVIINEFCELSGVSLDLIVHKATHRWKYANTIEAEKSEYSFYYDDNLKIGACGDWCIQGRVESAFLSADKLSKEILKTI